MKKFILLALVAILTMGAYAQKEQTVVIKTNASLNCQNCANRFKENVPFFKGVKTYTYDAKTAVLTINYDANKTNPDNLRQQISKLGYNADNVNADPAARAKLPACCRNESSCSHAEGQHQCQGHKEGEHKCQHAEGQHQCQGQQGGQKCQHAEGQHQCQGHKEGGQKCQHAEGQHKCQHAEGQHQCQGHKEGEHKCQHAECQHQCQGQKEGEHKCQHAEGQHQCQGHKEGEHKCQHAEGQHQCQGHKEGEHKCNHQCQGNK